ncbi:uncharacterized protein LOC124188126 isoform X3 [Neodiprion fabricii]|uniref:uncharacterized protein LOC124188126 isoform X3 n=1 Tax=Neodiprion fabricii TaxID=2872261 RepID=UPI001ED954ED|nr:uncharacterized protein LOC124188126 isoform X3 [Neodiprion fabricii]
MMLVLLLCVIMKIAEFSVGRSELAPSKSVRPVRSASPSGNKRKRRHRPYNRKLSEKCDCILQKRGSGDAAMDEPHTPGSDCNSNPSMDPSSQDLITSEFVHDNMDYQWFADCGYRDTGLHVHSSVLSSLSASYTCDDLRYDAECRYLDANFAEIDMESFRTADIHSLLTLPVICTDPVQHSEGEDSACSTTDTMSICKSSLLFSPVKETPVLPPGGSYSVDSLDCEDVLLTCQAHNKINYTIAFEGSMTMYSDGSQDFENQEKQNIRQIPDFYYDKKLNLKNMFGLSMAKSDSKVYTTWSNLKHSPANNVMTRHPSGNNNTMPNFLQANGQLNLNLNKKSQSLPDLTQTRELSRYPLNFSVDSAESNNHVGNLQSSGSIISRSINEDSSESTDHISTKKKLQNLSLVKRFMKQKSMSAEGMSMTLDQSGSASDSGWPTSNSESGSGSGTRTQIHQHNINNTCNNLTLENDFSINWVKSDYYNNKGTEHTFADEDFDNIIRKQSPLLEEFEGELQSSASIEDLSESISKIESMDGSRCEKHENSFLEDTVTQSNTEQINSSSKNSPLSKTTGTQVFTQVEDNSVQTSLIYLTKDKNYPSICETTIEKRPAYIVYPNYTLPDLSFLQLGQGKFDKVALRPQCFDRDRSRWRKYNKSNRPFSCNDLDAMKQRGFSHIKDWESLTFLLPAEYKRILHDVPEASKHVKLAEETKKPLFCLSPQMRHRARIIDEATPDNISSASSIGTQPSSGYRGSSTILTDSLINQQGVPNNSNPLYLYRYDSASSEASLTSQDTKQYRPSCKPKINAPTLPKRSISLPHGDRETRCNTKAPPRPPLPRGILRKDKLTNNKRYSMFEMGGVKEVENQQVTPETNKRMSLQEPYYLNNDHQSQQIRRLIDSEKDVDEVEERLYYAERLKESENCVNLELYPTECSDEIIQLEDFLRRSGFSSQSSDGDSEDQDVRLRSYVRQFLRLNMNKDLVKNVEMMESQKKTVSFAVQQRKEFLKNKGCTLSFTANKQSLDERRTSIAESPSGSSELKSFTTNGKSDMLRSVNKSVGLILNYWRIETVKDEQVQDNRNECAQLCLSNLCPALYAIMCDGLRPNINSSFGPLANSVWQVVEASSQQGPLTKTLNELVQKINGEDFITEGMLKFHAFVFGLLNLRALDAWFAYLCTRESILRKHYSRSSLFVSSLACVNAREMVDALLDILQPLALCPFQLDMLYQYRQLHNSLGHMNNHLTNATVGLKSVDLTEVRGPSKREFFNNIVSPVKVRPRSCVDYAKGGNMQGILHEANLNNTIKKRWSNLPSGSKLIQAFDKLTLEDSEDYTDSLEHSPLKVGAPQNVSAKIKSPPISTGKVENEEMYPGGVKFKKLQEKWELMIGKEENKEQPIARSPESPARTPTNSGKSKIPRLLSSPTKQPMNVLSPIPKSSKSTTTGIPLLKKSAAIGQKIVNKQSSEIRKDLAGGRTSRLDQETGGIPRTHFARPSSLPYRPPHGGGTKEKCSTSPHRRAASTSLPRPTAVMRNAKIGTTKPPLKEVKTLTHRLPSDNGHLSFSEGEKLTVILEVDNKWLLCLRGEHKGLVPRSCVHAVQT